MKPPMRARLAGESILITPLVRLLAVLATTLLLLGVAIRPVAARAAQVRHLSGLVTYLDGSSITIQTAGRRMGVVNALSRAADAVTGQNLPYVWGGGHAAAGVADAGEATGRRGRPRSGYDCSGATAAVLAAAGLWPAGSGVPNDAGVIDQLRQDGLIAPGPGRGPVEVTLYDHPGVHVFMNIDGRFFGTSDGGGGGNAAGGAGWLNDGAPDAQNRQFRQYHVISSVLRDRTYYGHSFTFGMPSSSNPSYNFVAGDRVNVAYSLSRSGVLLASQIQYTGALVVTGTVVAVAPDGSAFTLQTAAGQKLVMSTAKLSGAEIQLGQSAQVTYTKGRSAIRTARGVLVTAAPAPAPTTTAPASPAPPTTSPNATTTPAPTSGPPVTGTTTAPVTTAPAVTPTGSAGPP